MSGPPSPEPGTLRDALPCLLCGSTATDTLHRQDPYRIVRCTSCGLVYTLPRLGPEQLREMYQTDYWQSSAAKDFGYTDYLGDEERYVRTFHLRARLVERHVKPPARMLEVGCAAGFGLRAFRERGFDVYGVELSLAMAREARARAGGEDRVHAGVLEDGLFGDLRFDVITLWDVIEHVEDPIALLAQARRLLAPGGVLVFETQNVGSLFARLMGVRWQHYKFQEHLYHFDPRTVLPLLERAGLERVEWTRRLGGKYVSLAFIAERAGRVHPLLSVLLKPLSWVGDRDLYVNVFDEMLVVARPRAEATDG